MAILGFHDRYELNTYVTFVFLGMSVMMVTSAVTSAPDFITSYYKFALGDPDAVAESELFWQNANTFYNAGTYALQVTTEILSLTKFARSIPLAVRLYVGLCIPFLEMILLIVIPTVTIPTQNGAIAVLMTVACVGGFAKALCDSCTNALVGPFPTKFMNGEQWGLTVIALLMSVIECILKATMGSSFTDKLNQSRIYFGIGIGIQLISLAEMVLLQYNPFALKYIAEFRAEAERRSGRKYEAEGEEETPQLESSEQNAPQDGSEQSPATGEMNGPEEAKMMTKEPVDEEQEEDDGDEVREVSIRQAAVLHATGDADHMVDLDQNAGMTSTEQMLQVSLKSVFLRVYPMLLCVFLVFFTSLLIFPGVFFNVPNDDDWYMTLIVLLFNIGDFVSRILLMIRPLRPPPMVVIIGSTTRLIIIPFLVLCVRGIIPGVALPYVLITLLGLTNGFFGTMAALHCPRTPTLHYAGERSIAGIMVGIFIMGGLCLGSFLAVPINVSLAV